MLHRGQDFEEKAALFFGKIGHWILDGFDAENIEELIRSDPVRVLANATFTVG
jgi:hypothetical protein